MNIGTKSSAANEQSLPDNPNGVENLTVNYIANDVSNKQFRKCLGWKLAADSIYFSSSTANLYSHGS